jgi:sarcosine oxidase subunit alpha
MVPMNRDRLPEGGLIKRDQPIAFSFNGKRLHGYAGDSLASALLANGIRVVARGFKYHRPRGIYAAGSEEPNALIQIGMAARAEPNFKATEVELREGLVAMSQNCWPSVNFDLGAIASVLSPFLPPGFYYKTFMGPGKAWKFYERLIRKIAGQGRSPVDADLDHYEHRYVHCDVLVVGGGPAGMCAARAAAETGARVILADEGPSFGGALRGQQTRIDGAPAMDWVDATTSQLHAMAEVTLLPRATAFGFYDHNLVGIAERLQASVASDTEDGSRTCQRLWHVRAKQVVLATGSIERPLVFSNNDLPGIMLASAVRRYVNEFAVCVGQNAVIATNNDTAYTVALDLKRAGINVTALVDSRPTPPPEFVAMLADAGIPTLENCQVRKAFGGKSLRAVEVIQNISLPERSPEQVQRFQCDLLCVSGGWTPTVHLYSQSGGGLDYREDIAAFVPGQSKQAVLVVGAANGSFGLQACVAEGVDAGAEAALKAGFSGAKQIKAPAVDGANEGLPTLTALQPPSACTDHGKAFVDFQNDVTVKDLTIAIREGYDSVELLKRYTTLGMGTDQGKTSNMSGFAHLASALGVTPPQIGTTTFRPAYSPVTIGALTGPGAGSQLDPVRRSAMHDWHARAGAVFVTAGLWLRPRYYPQHSETMAEAIDREVRAVRHSIGIVDISTLGKIDIQGRDAAEFLERIYVNRWKNLRVGRSRYGVMLREDGMVIDDGTTTRLDENRFLMTTTTANAMTVMRHLEFYQQVVWPDLDVHLTSVTDGWAGIALAGPKARAVLERLETGIEASNELFPYMAYREGVFRDVPIRVFRISFSGELAYELNVPADYGMALWQRLLEIGQSFGITQYGTEAMAIMRIEKGHFVVNAEADGRVAPQELGLGGMLGADKNFIGKWALARKAFSDRPRQRIVGLVPEDGKSGIPRGAQIVQEPNGPIPMSMLGHVTSTCFSPSLGKPIALAMVDETVADEGGRLFASSPLTGVTVAVLTTSPVFIDPDGERLRV